MIIPNNFYRYLIIFIIIISIIISGYIYLNFNLESHKKMLLIWFMIIFELNLLHLYFIIKFYENNKNKKGIQGSKGDIGPRGFNGNNQFCNSCEGAGSDDSNDSYGGVINDNNEINQDEIDSNKLVPGKCIFPFIKDYKYIHGCSETTDKSTPLNSDISNYETNGWCATKVDDNLKPITFGYCNQINKLKKDKNIKFSEDKQKYIQDNYGILDVIVVEGNTEDEAKEKCSEYKNGQYKIFTDYSNTDKPFDLNENSDGKFIYLCYNEDVDTKGVNELVIGEKCSKFNQDQDNCDQNKFCKFNTSKNKCNKKIEYKREKVNLNEASADSSLKEIYLYKKYSQNKFIKDFQILPFNEDESNNGCLEDYISSKENINFGGSQTNMNLCYTKNADENIISIDSAFVYNKRLYIFRGSKYYRMSKIPIQGSLKADDGYPKYISEKWIKNSSNNNNIEDCSIYNDDKTMCAQHSDKCFFDISNLNQTSPSNNNSIKGYCEPKINFNAMFTYGYNKKTYFFKGGNVYLYDDENMTIANGYPKPITSIFKGIPNNIDAVFTWGKDNKTYFFKGKYYYKYNDEKNKVDSGYPKLIQKRWIGIPNQLNAIFTLEIALDNQKDNHPTYIVSGNKIFYIDSITDKVTEIGNLNDKLKFN